MLDSPGCLAALPLFSREKAKVINGRGTGKYRWSEPVESNRSMALFLQKHRAHSRHTLLARAETQAATSQCSPRPIFPLPSAHPPHFPPFLPAHSFSVAAHYSLVKALTLSVPARQANSCWGSLLFSLLQILHFLVHGQTQGKAIPFEAAMSRFVGEDDWLSIADDRIAGYSSAVVELRQIRDKYWCAQVSVSVMPSATEPALRGRQSGGLLCLHSPTSETALLDCRLSTSSSED
jgi:hypothetical protein